MGEHLQSMGFVQTTSYPCTYVAEGDDPFMIAIHVDDLILAGTADDKIGQVKQKDLMLRILECLIILRNAGNPEK